MYINYNDFHENLESGHDSSEIYTRTIMYTWEEVLHAIQMYEMGFHKNVNQVLTIALTFSGELYLSIFSLK